MNFPQECQEKRNRDIGSPASESSKIY